MNAVETRNGLHLYFLDTHHLYNGQMTLAPSTLEERLQPSLDRCLDLSRLRRQHLLLDGDNDHIQAFSRDLSALQEDLDKRIEQESPRLWKTEVGVALCTSAATGVGTYTSLQGMFAAVADTLHEAAPLLSPLVSLAHYTLLFGVSFLGSVLGMSAGGLAAQHSIAFFQRRTSSSYRNLLTKKTFYTLLQSAVFRSLSLSRK